MTFKRPFSIGRRRIHAFCKYSLLRILGNHIIFSLQFSPASRNWHDLTKEVCGHSQHSWLIKSCLAEVAWLRWKQKVLKRWYHTQLHHTWPLRNSQYFECRILPMMDRSYAKWKAWSSRHDIKNSAFEQDEISRLLTNKWTSFSTRRWALLNCYMQRSKLLFDVELPLCHVECFEWWRPKSHDKISFLSI